MKHIAVIGLGKVGSLVGTLLNDLFTVTGFDQKQPFENLPFDVITGDTTNGESLQAISKK